MALELTAFDALLLAVLAGAAVLGARRGLVGLVSGLAALAAWPLLNASGLHPLAGLGLGLGAGVGLGLLARGVASAPALAGVGEAARAGLGGFGGLLLGLALAGALALSFPTSPNPAAGPGAFYYPANTLPLWIKGAVAGSAIQRMLSSPPSRGGLGVWSGSPALRLLFLPDRR